MSVTISGLSKDFGEGAVLNGIDLEVRKGDFFALLGPSGSGKTSLLRIIAGLESASAGRLLIGGRDALNLPCAERRIGFVFQNYALFRHMRVFDNIAFGLQVRGRRERPARRAIARRVHELLDLVQLPGLERRFPSQLSGGQRQRVALARALAVEPEILLLDEPFGALDAGVRATLRQWLRGLHAELGLTSIFVTHDQEEALEVADRIALLDAGRIAQIGTPAELYDEPASAFVMAFLGPVNRLGCTVEGGRVRLAGDGQVLQAGGLAGGLPADGPATAYVRPYDVAIVGAGERGAGPAIVRSSAVIGARHRVVLQSGRQTLEAEIERDRIDPSRLAPGAAVGIALRRVRIFPREGGASRPAARGAMTEDAEPDNVAPLRRAPARAAYNR